MATVLEYMTAPTSSMALVVSLLVVPILLTPILTNRTTNNSSSRLLSQLWSHIQNRKNVNGSEIVSLRVYPRVLQGNGDPRLLGRTQNINFPDVHPFLIASEASIVELNSRLRKNGADPITMERFRPNVVIKGNTPWTEDSWKVVHFSNNNNKTPANEQDPPLSSSLSTRHRRPLCAVPGTECESGNG